MALLDPSANRPGFPGTGEGALGDAVALPEGLSLAGAGFARDGATLIVTSADGQRVAIPDFFSAAPLADLTAADGGSLPGELIAELAGDVAARGEAIGTVAKLSGAVAVLHADGSVATLHVGDSLFAGDIVQSATDGAAGLVLIDGSRVALGPARSSSRPATPPPTIPRPCGWRRRPAASRSTPDASA